MININPYKTFRRLAVIGASEFWYEDTMSGELVKLADSDGDLDTTEPLAMFELAQKLFIVNGERKKVADFVNTRLTVSGLENPPAPGDILTQDQGGDNEAFMVVDYVSPDLTHIYGFAYYAGDAEEWNTADSFESNNATGVMSPSTRTPSAVTEGPHWYDWTPFPDVVLEATGATRNYGEMPERVHLGCAYRGRAVIAGNPEAPFQWYMSRQLNPWDWAYFANDAGSAVAGGSSDAGQIGDIVRALIPYKDDYLIFGCSSTMHVLAGDPASHGELRELSLTTGIFGEKSYCWDGQNQLYFFGSNGLYRTTVPGAPVNISHTAIPNLINDAQANQDTHRVTMEYDRMRDGLLICITELSTGTSKNFWYDLRVVDESTVGGYFPEEYPVECGAYSLYFYDAPDIERRSLLIGCADGYIRKFEDTANNDELHNIEVPIESDVTFGPYVFSDREDYEGTLTGLNVVLAGGDPNGTQPDSDPVEYEVYTERSAEALLEKMKAGLARIRGSVRTVGRQRGKTRNKRARGAYLGLRLKNEEAAQSWGFEKILFSLGRGGRQK